jgi:hypothetical protein
MKIFLKILKIITLILWTTYFTICLINTINGMPVNPMVHLVTVALIISYHFDRLLEEH